MSHRAAEAFGTSLGRGEIGTRLRPAFLGVSVASEAVVERIRTPTTLATMQISGEREK